MNPEQIKSQAKQILDNFASALNKVKSKPKTPAQKTSGFREESTPTETDKEFKKQMFQNAPETESDFLIAEKKKW